MANSLERIPRSLATAYGALIEALDVGSREFSANLRHSNAWVVCRCIERFVHSLVQFPGAQAELQRRAQMIQTLCGPLTDYSLARKRSFTEYQGEPAEGTGARLAIQRLKEENGVSYFLANLSEERHALEHVLAEETLNLSDAARNAFQSWQYACRAVQLEAESLEPDGCWYLFQIYESGKAEPSEVAKGAKAIIQSEIGGGNLASIKAAAESMFAWAKANTEPGQDFAEPAEAASETKSSTKTKRSTERGEGRAKLIAALTKHHKYADGSCLNLEPAGNNELARLAGVSISTASYFFSKQFGGRTKYRAICSDVTQLIAALKLLNQEFSPHHLFGAKPPGEDEREDEE